MSSANTSQTRHSTIRIKYWAVLKQKIVLKLEVTKNFDNNQLKQVTFYITLHYQAERV